MIKKPNITLAPKSLRSAGRLWKCTADYPFGNVRKWAGYGATPYAAWLELEAYSDMRARTDY